MATLQKMIHTANDIYTDGNNTTIIIHIVDEITKGGEFTICGRAIPNSTLKFEGFQAVGMEFKGDVSKCDCQSCRSRLYYYKNLS